MLGGNFFIPGKTYQVITHRLDTQHEAHWFNPGETVKCINVVLAGSNISFLRSREFKSTHLKGYFINSKGVIQVMASGDVKRCRT